MRRVLRHGTSTYGSLHKSNADQAFAASNVMMIYPWGALYTLIPKNACSTLRLSVALHNGAIRSPADYRWIHKNNDAFRPTLSEILTSPYCFAVLRCPFSRLVSLFLDKFVSRDPVAWHFREVASKDVDLPSLTFRAFCAELCAPAVLKANKHWRPQVDFLLFEEYDDLFCVEDFSACVETLRRRIGLETIDSRPYIKHDLSRFKAVGGLRDNYADEEAWKIETLFRVGLRPSYASFFDDELVDLVTSIYAEDVALFRSMFPEFSMFRSEAASAQETKVA